MSDRPLHCVYFQYDDKENEQLKESLYYEQRMHEWFKNEAYLLQNKLDNREDEIINIKKENEQLKQQVKKVLLKHYKELTRISEGRIDCSCSAQSRSRIIAIMNELGVELK